MMETPTTPEHALEAAFALLAHGVADRRHPFHTPTLATRGLDGAPSLRTVVLRGFDAAAWTLRFHTDRRSAKAAELTADPRAMLHGYDPATQVQLRLAGRATLHHDDALAEAAWAAMPARSRLDYAAALQPGARVADPPAAPRDATGARANFLAAVIRVETIDWLLLAPDGHRRARFDRDAAGTCTAYWIAP